MKTKKSSVKSKNQSSVGGAKILFSSLKGSAVGVAAFFLCCIIFASVCTFMSNPHPAVLPTCFFTVYLSAFIAGLAAVKFNRGSDALLCGSACGALVTLTLWGILCVTASLLGGEGNSFSPIWKLLMIPASISGSFLGLSEGSKKPKRKT